jgi:GNAT superfamily N-acetyltransferase
MLTGEPAPDGHDVARQGDFLISTDPARLDADFIHDFLSNCSYWAAGRPLDIVQRSLANSLCFGLYKQRQQIGFARAVTDRATFAWICDVFILETYRGQGLGRWLMDAVVAHPALRSVKRLLLATRDAHGLYSRQGFAPLGDSARFMEVLRTTSSNSP